MNPHDPSQAQAPAALSRRELLKLLGGGILLGVYVPSAEAAQEKLPSAYLQIGTDGTVTLLSSKVEFGQGVMTSLCQMAAEELDLPLENMRGIMGDTGLCPTDSDGGTFGSLTTRNFGPAVRRGAARARGLLVRLASEQLAIAEDQLVTSGGYVMQRGNESVRVSYAELAGGKTVTRDLPVLPAPKSYKLFTLSGKAVQRLDAVEKVTGQAKYTADIRLPGMLYARILRPPARGVTLLSADTTEAEKVPGVRIVRTGSLIAVLHEQPDTAARALRLIQATWTSPAAGPNDETIYEYLLSRAPAAQSLNPKGNVTTGEQLATRKAEATYTTPYVAHSPIEPHAAVALPEAGKITLWASTQTPFAVVSEARVARVITPHIGGAFGGKNSNAQAREAADLARAAGVPVHLSWTREEEFFFDQFQVPSIVKIRSGVDAQGKITFWDYQVYWVAERGAAFFYDVPNVRVRVYGTYANVQPFAGGPWRAPGANANVFARESHIDSLAVAAGVEPVAFRLRHLQNTANARRRGLLEAAAQQFGWPGLKAPSGRGFGMACGEDAGTDVVTMAEVAVAPETGQVQVKRMLCAQNMGRVINPDGARQQMEGSMMMGLGYSLSEEIHFSNGRILDLNFNRYTLPRFSWMPKLETLLIPNDSTEPQGGGEPAVITTGAALANAVFDATGARMTRLPMTPERVLAAVQQASTLALYPPERAGEQIRFSWKGAPGVKLQKSASLSNPVWEDVAGTEGASTVTLPASEESAYFRLVRP